MSASFCSSDSIRASTPSTRCSISFTSHDPHSASRPVHRTLVRGCDSEAGRVLLLRRPAGVADPSAADVTYESLGRAGGPGTILDHRGPSGRFTVGRMPAAEPRYCVAEVTEEARDGWRDFADRYGIDRTALAEVIGLELGATVGPLPRHLRAWVDRAKDLKNQRRRRG